MDDANYAPVYCAIYPALADLARQNGYALSIHGSLARDFDLVALPWGETTSSPDELVDELVSTFAVRVIGEPELKHHGRVAYTLSMSYGECFIDLSFFLCSQSLKKELKTELEAENQALKEAIEWALLRQANVADYAVSDDSDTYYIRWLDEPTKLKRPPNPPFHEALIKAMLAERGKN